MSITNEVSTNNSEVFPTLLYFCTSVLLYFCTPVLLYFCTPVLLYSCTPVLKLHPAITSRDTYSDPYTAAGSRDLSGP